jgi:TatD DNase family protein
MWVLFVLMQLVDTHVHINFETFQSELDELAQRWRDAGVVRLVHSCVEPAEFEGIRAIADRFPEVFFAVGLHPLDVEEKWTGESAADIERLAESDSRVVAIGETGLDFFKASNVEQQLQAFEAQLAIAQRLNRPVIIHCRDAAPRMLDFLQGFWRQHGSVKGVMHCWSGDPAETQQFLDLGFYISFSGTVTFKKAVEIQASAQMVPSDRLLIETDCPFLAPVPQRGKRNEPAYVRHVAEQIAHLRNILPEELALSTTLNACQLFSLPTPKPSPALEPSFS